VKKIVSTSLPIAVIWIYWILVPRLFRKLLSSAPGTSVPAYHAIKAGGGWKAFWWHALPHRHGSGIDHIPFWMAGFSAAEAGSLHGGPFDWEHYK
jgi:hypothetical protein